MSNERTFIFYPDWLDCIDRINNKEDQYDLMKIILDYGCHNYYDNENTMMIAIFESLIKPKIDKAQENYEGRVEGGKKSGRKKVLDDDMVESLRREGKTAEQIAKQFGVSKDAVNKNAGWQRITKEKKAEREQQWSSDFTF